MAADRTAWDVRGAGVDVLRQGLAVDPETASRMSSSESEPATERPGARDDPVAAAVLGELDLPLPLPR